MLILLLLIVLTIIGIFIVTIAENLKRIENKLNLLIKKENQMANTLDEVLQDVQAESTVADSIVVLLNSVEQQLKEALENSTISPADQAKVDAIFAGIEANKKKLADAVTANTPAA